MLEGRRAISTKNPRMSKRDQPTPADGLAKPERRGRRSADAKVDAAAKPEMIPYLTGAPAEAAIGAIIDDHSAWKKTADGRYFYGEQTKSYIAIGDPRSVITPEEQELAWNKILALDDGAAQTLIYVMSRDLAASEAVGVKTRIHVNDILSFKDYKRQAGGDFPASIKRQEQNRLLQLSDMWAAVNDEIVIKHGRTLRRKRIKTFSRLIELEIEVELDSKNDAEMRALTLPSIMPANSVPYAFNVSLGGWATPYKSASTFVRAALAKIVQFDTSVAHQLFAMRIAIRLMFGNSERRMTVREVLSQSYIEIPTTKFERFRDSVEKALDVLQTYGLISGWEYDNNDEVALPKYKWFDAWTAWNVVFTQAPIAVPIASA